MDLYRIIGVWLVPTLLPISQGALVYAEELLAFDGGHFQIEPSSLDLFTNVPWISRKMACLP